jgi:ABC-type transport system involved in cytochrome c biogenesis permease subunit
VNVIPFSAYVAALAVYGWHFSRRQLAIGRAATSLLVLAVMAHTFVIGMKTMELGQIPVIGTTAAVSTFVWLLAVAYLYTELTTEERGMGTFILTILVGLQAVATFGPEREEQRAAVLQGPMFGLHVSSLLIAYASFALACVIGITYVLLFKEIKAKHLGFFYARLPSLQVLDTMNQRVILFGWVCLTIGIIVGALWTPQARSYASGDPRLQAMSLQDPKIFIALLCWSVYSFEIFFARRIGWGGRRAAYLSAFGFALVLLNFLPVSYFLTRSHNF